MKNPTKAEKLKWTKIAVECIATDNHWFSCCAILRSGRIALHWYEGLLERYAGSSILVFSAGAKDERLMWLCFLITLIEHGEPELTNL